MQHISTTPPSLREQLPALPVIVEQVVMRAIEKDPKNRFAKIEEFATALEQTSQQVEMSKPAAEYSSSVHSSLPMHHLFTARPMAEKGNVENRVDKDISFAPISKVSFFGEEGIAQVSQSVDEPFTSPTIPLTIPTFSRQEPTLSCLPPPASSGNPQNLQRRRFARRTAMLVLILVVLILGSVGGLFERMYISTTRTHATATANAQMRATARVQAAYKDAADDYARFVATNGIMFGFDARHSHANPYEQILNPTTVGNLTKLWAFQTGNYVDSSPIVVNGVVYVGSGDGNLYALDAASGAKKWVYPTGIYIHSSPAVVNGVVYVGSEDNNVYALNAASGTKKWAYHTGWGISSSPAVVNDVVYIGSTDHSLYTLDAATGAKIWSYSTGDRIISSPIVVNGVVYIGSEDDNLYAINAASGAKLWAYRTGNSVSSSPAVVNGMVYVGSDDHNLYAFHLSGT